MIPLLVPEILPCDSFCDEERRGIGYSSSWMYFIHTTLNTVTGYLLSKEPNKFRQLPPDNVLDGWTRAQLGISCSFLQYMCVETTTYSIEY